MVDFELGIKYSFTVNTKEAKPDIWRALGHLHRPIVARFQEKLQYQQFFYMFYYMYRKKKISKCQIKCGIYGELF